MDDEEDDEEKQEEEDENVRKVVEEEITLPLSQWLSATECDDPSPRSQDPRLVSTSDLNGLEVI